MRDPKLYLIEILEAMSTIKSRIPQIKPLIHKILENLEVNK
jgi:uncharacterized protein with HEPN domain